MSETTPAAAEAPASVPADQLPAAPDPETPADTAAQPEPTADPAKPAEPEGGFQSKSVQKRIAKLTFEREQAIREATAAKALLESHLKGDPAAAPPAERPQDFDRRVNQTAAQLRAQEAFNEASNRTFEKGVAEFPDFKNAVQAYELIGGINDKTDFVKAINALPNGHAVFHHLGKNLDAASDILEMEPVQMAIKLAELSGSLAKPPKKSVSNAPTPPAPISGNAGTHAKDPDKMTMAEYMEWRKTTL